jgi:hypothetical protein
LAGSPLCKRCGASLPGSDAINGRQERRAQTQVSAVQVGSCNREATPPDKSHNLSRLSLIVISIGLIFLAAVSYVGGLAYMLAVFLFLLGVVTSVMALIRRKRSHNPHALWLPVTGLMVNAALLITFGIAVPAVVFSSLAGGKSPSWREYVSQDGGFTIQMPDEPEVSVDQISTSSGMVPMHSIHADLKGGASCTSIYLDYSAYQLTIPIEDFLENAIKRFVESSNAVLVAKKTISLEGYNGFEIETTPNSTVGALVTSSTARLYWVPERKFVYVIHITGPSSGELYSQRSLFLESFHFLFPPKEDEKPAEPDFGNSPLVDAVSKGDMARVNSLLQQEPNEFDKQLAMIVAVYNAQIPAVEALIRARTSLTIGDGRGRTPLMLAAVRCRRCIPVLVRAGADLNAQDEAKHWTALMWSVNEGQAVCASDLIKAGTNVNLRDRRGKTALMHAAGLRYKEVVEQLLTSGADPNIQDDDGQTALDHADRNAQLNPTDQSLAGIVMLLKNASGKR